jgi:hypothetical protein
VHKSSLHGWRSLFEDDLKRKRRHRTCSHDTRCEV